MIEIAAVALNHIVRRSFTTGSAVLAKRGEKDPNGPPQPPAWGAALLFFTILVMGIAVLLTEYSLRFVVGTLAMIESPAAAVVVTPVPAEEPAEEADVPIKQQHQVPLLETGTPSITLAHSKPLTSSIRATIRHITTIGGFAARWRGFGAFIVYALSFSIMSNIITFVFPSFLNLNQLVGAVGAAAFTAPIHMAWTHAVISMPSKKTVFSRTAPTAWLQVALPAAVCAGIPQVIFLCFVGLTGPLGFNKPVKDKHVVNQSVFALVYAVLALFIYLFITLPAMITYIRIEASLLPEDDETILPFDRSFNGQVVPRILGGTGAIGFVDAWKTCAWEARRRIFKLMLKTAAVIFCLWFATFILLGSEMAIIFGSQTKQVAAHWQNKVTGGEL